MTREESRQEHNEKHARYKRGCKFCDLERKYLIYQLKERLLS